MERSARSRKGRKKGFFRFVSNVDNKASTIQRASMTKKGAKRNSESTVQQRTSKLHPANSGLLLRLSRVSVVYAAAPEAVPPAPPPGSPPKIDDPAPVAVLPNNVEVEGEEDELDVFETEEPRPNNVLVLEEDVLAVEVEA